MISPATVATTTPRVVLPFYGYGAGCFLLAALLLLRHSENLNGHYFQPSLLALTHLMALGWGTMMTFGASYQLMPVLTGKALWSDRLAQVSFWLTGAGIPLLVWGFYSFNLGLPAQAGGALCFLGISVWLFNMAGSIDKKLYEQVHAVFLFTAGIWLWITALVGLTLLLNFRYPVLSQDSLHYLSVHAHLGIVGWFLLLILGVGSRLIPMFLISKYENRPLLWGIYGLVNGGLLIYVLGFLANTSWTILPAILTIGLGICLFLFFCVQAYKARLRRQVDIPVRLSLLSGGMMLLPVLLLIFAYFRKTENTVEAPGFFVSYGFLIFFGWITAMLLGMTFKTLPFIVWNKVYGKLAGQQQTPSPNELVNERLLRLMRLVYLSGLSVLFFGLALTQHWMLRTGAGLLALSAVLYGYHVFKILSHKSRNIS